MHAKKIDPAGGGFEGVLNGRTVWKHFGRVDMESGG